MHPIPFPSPGRHETAELVAGERRRRLANALSLGSAAWVALFALALALPPVTITRIVTVRPPIDSDGPTLEPPPLLEPPPSPPEVEIRPPSVAEEGLILPVPDESDVPRIPPAESLDARRDPGPGDHDAAGPGAIPSGGGVAVTAPREPGIDEWVEVDQLPIPIFQPVPAYPEIAVQARVEGIVVLAALVGPDGRVRRVVIERSVLLLDEAARAAALRWTFQPALQAGRPVMVWVRIPMRFTLH